MFSSTQESKKTVRDITYYARDGRLTEPSDGKKYEWQKMLDHIKRLGRPLSEQESSFYLIK